jgi:CRP-like cAMP-binding protein
LRDVLLTHRNLIAKLPLFAELGADDVKAVLNESRSARFPKNACVFQQGEEAKSFFVLLGGHIRAEQHTRDGAKIIDRYVSAGEIFGAVEATGLKHYPATATAVVDSIALAWPSRTWPLLAARHPQLAVNALLMIGRLLQEARLRVLELQTEEVERRVARTLLRLAHQAGRKDGGAIEIDFPIRRQDVAEISGATLHTVSRILSSWERRGITAGGHQRIILRDPRKLLGLAEGRRASAASSGSHLDGLFSGTSQR